jgi:hypothetical protein
MTLKGYLVPSLALLHHRLPTMTFSLALSPKEIELSDYELKPLTPQAKRNLSSFSLSSFLSQQLKAV